MADKFRRLRLTLFVKGSNIRAGQPTNQLPQAVVSFYDERRAVVGEEAVGPFSGYVRLATRRAKILRVPLRAREAIVRIGLLGAVGDLSIDDVNLSAIE